jgi:asparagine synthase (glutamine-hydrolysing)
MSGIAGLVDLTGSRPLPAGVLQAMTEALAHRGPDGASFHEGPGVGLGWRLRASAPDVPAVVTNEDGSVAVVCQARLTNFESLRERFPAAGRPGRGASEADLLVRLWEEHGAGLLERLRGPFAVAVWDGRRRSLFLGRDRVGCAPLYWAERDGWLLFGSEVKALLASGMVRAEVDRLGVDHVFTFLGMPVARTCFRDVQALPPGHYLTARLGARVEVRRYWDLDFPDRGDEDRSMGVEAWADSLQETLLGAVRRRLRAGEPVASYVSGGIDCSTLVALAGKARGEPLPTFTIRIESPELDEAERARRAARASGSEPVVVSCGAAEILGGFPRLIRAAEQPVLDPSCVGLMLLAGRVREAGYSLALAGDGADDLFAGYPWFKVDRLLRLLDWLPGVRPSQWARRLYLRLTAPHVPWANVRRSQALLGGHHAWLDFYGLVSLSRSRFYSRAMREALGGRTAYEDLSLDLGRMRRWHPLNQALYLGLKVHVPGLLLQAKGDRPAMVWGLQTQTPFLDEDVLAFGARLPPRWKLRRLRDKYLLRRVAQRWLPADIAWRPKTDFVAPFDSLYNDRAPGWVEELLGEDSLRSAGYFDPAAVRRWRGEYATLRRGSPRRISVEIGLAGVVATQLWHHTFIGRLADLPGA